MSGSPEGFTTKNRNWNKVEILEGWREAWARDINTALERAVIRERVDHRTLEAQCDEALELASTARERGDEGAELVQTVRAVKLNHLPLSQLSPGAWQMTEFGIEVGHVGACAKAARPRNSTSHRSRSAKFTPAAAEGMITDCRPLLRFSGRPLCYW